MNAYFTSLLGAAILTSMVGILLPGGSSGIGKHVRLVSALILFCIIAAPLPGLISGLRDFSFQFPDTAQEESFEERAENALNAASRSYFVRALTENLEQKFNIKEGEIQCAVQWESTDTQTKPAAVTVLLSGSARWKNPHEITSYVSELLHCTCEAAIE